MEFGQLSRVENLCHFFIESKILSPYRMALLVSRTQKASIKLFVGDESGFVGFNWSILDVPKIMLRCE